MSRSLSGRDRVRLVAAREIRERVRARSFQITTVLVALAVAAAIVIPNLGDEGPDTVRLGQVGTPTAETRETAEAAARLAGLRVELVTLSNTGAAEGASGRTTLISPCWNEGRRAGSSWWRTTDPMRTPSSVASPLQSPSLWASRPAWSGRG